MKEVCSIDLACLITSEKGPDVLSESNQKVVTRRNLNGTI